MSEKLFNRFFSDPYAIILSLGSKNLLNWLPDEIYLRCIWKAHFKTKLNIKSPQTFSEKIQWLKLYNRLSQYTTMVDKYRVRQYIADKIGEEYLIPLLGVWKRGEDIDFEQLPEQFVLKCNHDSGSVIVCKNKITFNRKMAIKKLNKRLKIGTYWPLREWAYKNVEPCIIAEKYMKDEFSENLLDYKFYCFGGEPRFLYVGDANFKDGVKHDLLSFYDMNWEKVPFSRPAHAEIPFEVKKPGLFDKMVEISRTLSAGIPFVRVDLYYIDGKIYFSELTFYPGSGLGPFSPDEWERKIGSWIELPEKQKEFLKKK